MLTKRCTFVEVNRKVNLSRLRRQKYMSVHQKQKRMQTQTYSVQMAALEDFGRGLLKYIYPAKQIADGSSGSMPELILGDFRLTVSHYGIFTLRYLHSGFDLTLISGVQHVVYHYLLEFIRENNIPCGLPPKTNSHPADDLLKGWTTVRI
jgi:hypothetical protein